MYALHTYAVVYLQVDKDMRPWSSPVLLSKKSKAAEPAFDAAIGDDGRAAEGGRAKARAILSLLLCVPLRACECDSSCPLFFVTAFMPTLSIDM